MSGLSALYVANYPGSQEPRDELCCSLMWLSSFSLGLCRSVLRNATSEGSTEWWAFTRSLIEGETLRVGDRASMVEDRCLQRSCTKPLVRLLVVTEGWFYYRFYFERSLTGLFLCRLSLIFHTCIQLQQWYVITKIREGTWETTVLSRSVVLLR